MEYALLMASALVLPAQAKEVSPPAPKQAKDSTKSGEAGRPRIKAVVGTFSVSVSKVEVAPMTVQDAASKKMFDSKCEYLHVYLTIRNKSKGEMVDYIGWGNPTGALKGRPEAKLIDNLGKRMEQIPGQQTFTIAGQISTKPLYPGTTISDVLIFKRPAENVASVKLRLSGKAVGAPGDFDLEIPAVVWSKKSQPKPP
jgi:hypothetical protein